MSRREILENCRADLEGGVECSEVLLNSLSHTTLLNIHRELSLKGTIHGVSKAELVERIYTHSLDQLAQTCSAVCKHAYNRPDVPDWTPPPSGRDGGQESPQKGPGSGEGDGEGQPEQGEGQPEQGDGESQPEQGEDSPEDKAAKDAVRTLAEKLGVKMDQNPDGIEKMIRDGLKEVQEIPRPVEVRQPGKEPKQLPGPVPKVFDRMLQLAAIRENIMLWGPTGCGKTHVSGMLAEALDLPFGTMSCTTGMSESQIQGWRLPVDTGNFAYIPADFVNKFENGGVYLLDECDSLDDNASMVINQALANGVMYIPQRFENPRVVKSEDFICVAAVNTLNGADVGHTGRSQLDKAFMDRFAAGLIHMDYDPEVEKSLVDPELLAWGHEVRAQITKNKLERRAMSMRFLARKTIDKEVNGVTLEQVKEQYFLSWTDKEKKRMPPHLVNAA